MSNDVHSVASLSAEEAMLKLQEGNKNYLDATMGSGDISPAIRKETCENGQHPYAIIVTCSDSRVIPESIFSAGIGELFVIRVAGNVLNEFQLGSVEYAAEHLGCNLVVVLGHTHCGAVGAAIGGGAGGFVESITREIKAAIGEEKDDYKACCLNVAHGVKQIEDSLEFAAAGGDNTFKAAGAVYHIEDGRVEFLSE